MPADLPQSACASEALASRHFVVPKFGEPEANCQDSVAVRNGSANDEAPRAESLFAIADGATESFCPRDWAQALTQQFIGEPKLCFYHWNEWLNAPRKRWLEIAQQALQEMKPEFRLFHENSLKGRRPAAATFVGLRVRHSESGDFPWRALVLGDSALFHLRADGTVLKYGLKHSADYTGDALMTLSYSSDKSAAPKRLDSHFADNGEAEMQSGDTMLLATDALAKWLLEREESGAPMWGAMLRLQTTDDFARFVERARADASLPLKNDDMSLIVVSRGAPHGVYARQEFSPGLAPQQILIPLTPVRKDDPPPRPAERASPDDGKMSEAKPVAQKPEATVETTPAPEANRLRRSKPIEWLSSNMPVVGLNLAFLFLISFVAAFDNSLFQYLSFGVNLLAIFLIAYLDVDAASLSQKLDEQKSVAQEQARRIEILEGTVRQALSREKKP